MYHQSSNPRYISSISSGSSSHFKSSNPNHKGLHSQDTFRSHDQFRASLIGFSR